ncbi:MAG: DEAD/DEAH box helicase [Gemmatimonadaceae bacterium]|nr:DEAD/DEAH box helicase [Gemmatimonadaceae bacterium]
MPTFALSIPPGERDAAKLVARSAGTPMTWQPATRTWAVTAAELPAALRRYSLGSAQTVLAMERIAPAGRVVSAPRQAGPAPVHVLDVPFALKSLAREAGARYDSTQKVWTYAGHEVPDALTSYRNQPYSWERWVEAELNDIVEPTYTPPAVDAPVPRPHQVEAIRRIFGARAAERPGFLLADDVGIGKTISAWGAVLRMKDAVTVCIVSPKDVVPHWRRTIAQMGDEGKWIVCINYDRLEKLFDASESSTRVRSKKGLARFAKALGFDVLILDESHKCKNPASARSKLVSRLQRAAGFTLWLSATAGQSPVELQYLAPLLASTTGDKLSEVNDFRTWCAGRGIHLTSSYGQWVWNEAENPEAIDIIRGLLFGGRRPAGIRRRPSDIAGWPEVTRLLTPVVLDHDERALYDAAWHEFREELGLIAQGGISEQHALVVQLRFRQKASLLRTGATIAQAIELLENGKQVAISVEFHETLEVIRSALEKERYACAVLKGGMPAGEKEAERIRFQRGECPVVIYTVKEGISLHAGERAVGGNDVERGQLIHDLRWSALEMAQIEGRTHRDGRSSLQYWMLGEDTVEVRIARVVAGRVSAMKGMMGDDRGTIREIERVVRGG